MIIELTLLACIGVFIFIFNSVAMRRSQVDQCRFHIEALLKRRQEVAREINPELAAELTGPITEWLKLDSETEQRINALPEPAAEQLADYRELGELLRQKLEHYRSWCAAYNRAVTAPPFCWLPKNSKFSQREQF